MFKLLHSTNATTVNNGHSHPSIRLRLTSFTASRPADKNNDWSNDMLVIPKLPELPVLDAVVKVSCFHSPPDPSQPWQRKKPYWSHSSGFVIEGRMILTNAHSVDYHTLVELKKPGSNTKYVATVLAIGTECDIAMLTVRDVKFWEGISPVKFGVLPARLDAVTVVGYPIGGDTISVTNGVVSRIEILSYLHGSTELLGMQIDAAINSGNSGGPVFNDKEECVGIAFQCLVGEDVESIGYVIPVPVVEHFIQDYKKNGAYTGFPILGIEWQKMENPVLLDSVGIRPDQKGIRVRGLKPSAQPSAPESQQLKPSDVFLSFDGFDIASDGTVPFRVGERMGFSYLVSQKYIGDNALVKVLRNRKTREFKIKLAKHKELIPSHIEGKPPFYIIAGFVFIVLSRPYERSEFGDKSDIPIKRLNKHLHAMAESIDEHPGVVQSIDKQIVVVSQVLAADINIGYEDSVYSQVETFNGKAVKNLKSLASMVENCTDEYLKFGLEGNQLVVLQTKRAKAETQDILTAYGIPSSMSDDLKTKESVSKKKKGKSLKRFHSKYIL